MVPLPQLQSKDFWGEGRAAETIRGKKKRRGESRKVYYKALFGEVFDTALVFILPLVT